MMRQHATILQQYTGDWGDRFPLILDPSVPISRLRWESKNRDFEYSYFHSSIAWPIALSDGYYDGRVSLDLFVSATETYTVEEGIPLTSYSYPCTFIARPEFWNPTSRLANPARQTGATSSAEVRFPSLKALLVRQTRADWPDLNGFPVHPTMLASTDGSVARFDPDRIEPAEVRADGAFYPWSTHVVNWPVAHHTTDGVHGRDIR